MARIVKNIYLISAKQQLRTADKPSAHCASPRASILCLLGRLGRGPLLSFRQLLSPAFLEPGLNLFDGINVKPSCYEDCQVFAKLCSSGFRLKQPMKLLSHKIQDGT